MALASGTRLGPYEITAQIGVGGLPDGIVAELTPFVPELGEFARTGTAKCRVHGCLTVESDLAHDWSFLESAWRARSHFREGDGGE